MMIRRRFWPMLVAALLFVLTVLEMGPVTKWVVTQFYLKPGVIEQVAGSQSNEVFKGTILQQKGLENQDILPVYGSSEFSSVSAFHPSFLFEGRPTGFTPFLIGHGGCQDLVHVLNVAAQGQALRGKKVVVILSAQWFEPEGLTPDYLAENFSPLQAYYLLLNNQLTVKTKQQVASRLLQYPYVTDNYPFLARLLAHYGQNDTKSRIVNLIYSPLGHIEMAALEVKDAFDSIKLLQIINVNNQRKLLQGIQPVPKPLPLKSWTELSAQATQAGQMAVTNNSFGIEDSYYLEYINKDLTKEKGSAQKDKLTASPEYQDLQLLLDVLKQTGVKPMFVIVPVNGRWADYTGFPLVERQTYYQRARQMVEQQGFQVADFSGHEYDLYFLKDIMHLGWKGWVDVDEAMDHFVH
ncbi:MAG: D-alanyl-lipoteichoic acid biosynthesis protein DltD [Desulfosporosinus sp.]|nr:D-alanyl-lipoteichoic acid biosynthesis protein DltD [Desulfosporosinus sp.]